MVNKINEVNPKNKLVWSEALDLKYKNAKDLMKNYLDIIAIMHGLNIDVDQTALLDNIRELSTENGKVSIESMANQSNEIKTKLKDFTSKFSGAANEINLDVISKQIKQKFPKFEIKTVDKGGLLRNKKATSFKNILGGGPRIKL